VDAVAGPRAGQPGLLWQGAYLVRRTEARRFQAVLQRFAGRLGGARIESTGRAPRRTGQARRPRGARARAGDSMAANSSQVVFVGSDGQDDVSLVEIL